MSEDRDRFTIYWHAGMAMYRVSIPNLSPNGERIEVVRAATHDAVVAERDALRSILHDMAKGIDLHDLTPAFRKRVLAALGGGSTVAPDDRHPDYLRERLRWITFLAGYLAGYADGGGDKARTDLAQRADVAYREWLAKVAEDGDDD